jgi:hypothetical protein
MARSLFFKSYGRDHRRPSIVSILQAIAIVSALTLMLPMAIGQQPAVSLSPLVATVFDAMYLGFSDADQDRADKRIDEAVNKVFAEMSGAPLDEFAASLLQFEIPPPVGTRLKEYCALRPAPTLVYLKKYRDTPFRLPAKYKYSMRWDPVHRRLEYDALIAQLEHRRVNHFGLDPKVEKFVVPILDSLSNVIMHRDSGDVLDPMDKIVASQTPAADEALVVLLDYTSDGAYTQELQLEIVDRGKRMLKWLYKYQNHPNVVLAQAYLSQIQRGAIERMAWFEEFIEAIELGEKFELGR